MATSKEQLTNEPWKKKKKKRRLSNSRLLRNGKSRDHFPRGGWPGFRQFRFGGQGGHAFDTELVDDRKCTLS
ncbi:hypothetical protein CEXT_561591 [Caerostris extrusa]|uniref:Uncharacterized protein n=1 Tax=Caerostris extrusa TaxID=172846 RepID=A0AAV4WPQ7_CAEEX|nr:hypothetical protein CEXT_561591 [Caerostris extrusa]